MQTKNNSQAWNFQNSYIELPTKLYTKQLPVSVKNPQIFYFNQSLAKELGLEFLFEGKIAVAEYLSGNKIPEGAALISQAYAGHQFGHFTMLGDGRAVLLGEQINKNNQRYDIQLKGSGQTPYSRSGDGRATLSSMLREYIISESMHYLGVPTTRSLAVALTGEKVIRDKLPNLIIVEGSEGKLQFRLKLSPDAESVAKKTALNQNITTLRNRVNELGVAEPTIQQQGAERIVVQLPGVQDTARAKEILGAVATLEFRLVDEKNDLQTAVKSGKTPSGSKLYYFRDGRPLLLKSSVIVTGENIVDASSRIDQESNSPMVNIVLDNAGGKSMLETTKEYLHHRMAVVFIENKVETIIKDGETIKSRSKTQDIINAATIQGTFSNRFQITGIDSSREAQNLALLLRAGSLSAPIEIIEERTIGPSLGADNIQKGLISVLVGFAFVLIFMGWRYRVFGLVANVALTLNLITIVSILSLLQATLTLPGIAGIVLTVGMAVDANVLIFERIKEELRSNNNIQKAISAGYGKALLTIADANITTLIASLVLFSFGTGPVKGFAVTLSIGIITSMFTAIIVSRAIINIIYGGKKVKDLAI